MVEMRSGKGGDVASEGHTDLRNMECPPGDSEKHLKCRVSWIFSSISGTLKRKSEWEGALPSG